MLSSDVTVVAEAKLVDLKTGQLLWDGRASASSAEQQNNSGGLVGMLVSAVINQIANSLTEKGHVYAGIASQRLLSAHPNGVLYGPRSPRYGQDGVPQ
ncbi:putative lipoprotein [compost metagenome]